MLDIVKQSKLQTGQSLAQALKTLGEKPFSEQALSRVFKSEIAADSAFYEDGWYDPPPGGVISLFGKPEDNYTRICEPSFRPEHMWPRDDLLYNAEDMIAVYASPVHRETKIIGDFGLTLYKGSNIELRTHCENVLHGALHIAGQAKPGMAFRELYAFGMAHGESLGFSNEIGSPTDVTGTNIGHTIPLSYKSDPTHTVIAQAKSFEDIREALRTGRKFINSVETQKIEPDMAFTIEPRFSCPPLPQTWFHLTVIFSQGEKQICHGFEPVFEAFGIDYLQKILN